MEKLIKNMDHGVVVPLVDQIAYQTGQISSKTLAQNKHHNITLFAFEQGEEISSHKSAGDAFVVALDGIGTITIGDKEHTITAGEAIVMPAQIPHAVYAKERFKMLLTVVFAEQQ